MWGGLVGARMKIDCWMYGQSGSFVNVAPKMPASQCFIQSKAVRDWKDRKWVLWEDHEDVKATQREEQRRLVVPLMQAARQLSLGVHTCSEAVPGSIKMQVMKLVEAHDRLLEAMTEKESEPPTP